MVLSSRGVLLQSTFFIGIIGAPIYVAGNRWLKDKIAEQQQQEMRIDRYQNNKRQNCVVKLTSAAPAGTTDIMNDVLKIRGARKETFMMMKDQCQKLVRTKTWLNDFMGLISIKQNFA